MQFPLHALLLAGGYSTRMGMDKCLIAYHGVPQHVYLAKLLEEVTDAVFISCRPDQVIDTPLTKIIDTTNDIGPMAGLLAAFDYNPEVAWIVVACDMPLVDKAFLSELIHKRDVSKQAAYFIDPSTQKPEPLLAIFEPAIISLLKSQVEQADYSLNRLLQQCDGNAILPSDAKKLMSVNTKAEYDEIITLLKK